jgi:hypothetical protein
MKLEKKKVEGQAGLFEDQSVEGRVESVEKDGESA